MILRVVKLVHFPKVPFNFFVTFMRFIFTNLEEINERFIVFRFLPSSICPSINFKSNPVEVGSWEVATGFLDWITG